MSDVVFWNAFSYVAHHQSVVCRYVIVFWGTWAHSAEKCNTIEKFLSNIRQYGLDAIDDPTNRNIMAIWGPVTLNETVQISLDSDFTNKSKL